MLEALTSLATLTVLEVVLSIDNLIVIAVLVGKLPKSQQPAARYAGMTMALVPRLVLLIFIGWIIGLTEPMFTVFGHGVSGKDLILAVGGLFLIYKATHEIHASLEGEEGEASTKVMVNFTAVVVQIALINLVFSIDSIVTAVGMANEILGDGRCRDPVDDRAHGRLGPGRLVRRGASDRQDPRPRLPDHDRHGLGRRRVRSPRAEGLYLYRHDLFGVHRVHQHGAAAPGQAGAPA